jgi:hypothetical protein
VEDGSGSVRAQQLGRPWRPGVGHLLVAGEEGESQGGEGGRGRSGPPAADCGGAGGRGRVGHGGAAQDGAGGDRPRLAAERRAPAQAHGAPEPV